jgi:6-pyruvoyl-tetrahydropterin synthase
VEAGVEGILDPEKPWVLDLHTIEENLRETVSSLEGRDLNDLIPYPSLEGVALWIYARLKDRFPSLKRILLEAPPRYRVVLVGEKM